MTICVIILLTIGSNSLLKMEISKIRKFAKIFLENPLWKRKRSFYNVRLQDNADQRKVLAVVNEIEVGQAHITYADTG